MTKGIDRVALVTGGSGGIGRAVAEKLASQGVAVGIAYGNSETKAAETVEKIIAEGGRAFAIKGDVTHAADVKRLFDETEKKFGKISQCSRWCS